MNAPEQPSASNPQNIDKPELTIVGPRPSGEKAGRIPVPQGMEGLLKLACLDPEWQKKVLADPVATAREARIALSPTEQQILKSVPPRTLAAMVASFVKAGLTKLRAPTMAAGTAAAALLAADHASAESDFPVTRGISPDLPDPVRFDSLVTTIDWMPLDKALGQAASNRCAVMVVFPYAATDDNPDVLPTKGHGIDLPTSSFLVNLGQGSGQAVSDALKEARVLAVKVTKTSPEAYLQALNRFQVSRQAPVVIFLAPDQSPLAKVQPRDEDALCLSIKLLPGLLQAWQRDQEKPLQSPAR